MTPDGRLGVEGASRRLPRWTADEAREAGVGVDSDADIAARWGVTRQAIAAARRALRRRRCELPQRLGHD
jgi:hypothetical protein